MIVVLAREVELGHLATAAVAAAVATGLASLSYELLEHPIRSAPALDRYRPVVIASGLALSLVVGVVIVPRVFDRASAAAPGTAQASGAAGRAGSGRAGAGRAATGAAPAPSVLDVAFRDNFDTAPCQAARAAACSLAAGSGPKAIVVGDSHAGMLTPMLEDLARRHHLDLHGGYLPFCPWPRGINYQGSSKTCFADQAELYDRTIPELDPDIVFLAHRPIDDVNDPLTVVDEQQGPLRGSADRQVAAVDRRITDLVHELRADGRTVVIFEPIPVVAKARNPLTCLSSQRAVEPCRFVTRAGPGPEEQTIRRLAAEDPGVVAVNLDPLICPYLPICDPVVDDLVVKRDDNHLTVTFARSLREPVEAYLVAQGVLD